jgi:hypothetical protein
LVARRRGDIEKDVVSILLMRDSKRLCNMVNRRNVYCKRVGPSIYPCGTPEEQFRVDDVEFPRRAVCDLRTICEESNSKAVPDTPQLADNLYSRMLYVMV